MTEASRVPTSSPVTEPHQSADAIAPGAVPRPSQARGQDTNWWLDAGLPAVGLAQGLGLWALWFFASKGQVLAQAPARVSALVLALLAMPIALYWTVDARIGRGERLLLVLACGLLFGYIGWHQAATSVNPLAEAIGSPWENLRFANVAAALGAGIVLVHLWACRKADAYAELFELTWHNAIATGFAVLFTVLAWAILYAGAGLLFTVDIRIARDILGEEWFALPASTLMLAFGFVRVRRRPELIVGLRRAWLGVTAWLLPVALAFGLVWVLAMPFAKTMPDADRRLSAGGLLVYLLLSIGFLNAAWQDGRTPAIRKRAWQVLLRWLWLVTIPVALYVAWAIAVRVGQHGWTERRIWSAFLAVLCLAWTLGYALPARRGRGWLPWVGRVNVLVAILAAVGALALLMPPADARRLAAADQLHRALAADADPQDVDLAWLRWRAGSYGLAALQQLAERGSPALAAAARAELARKSRFEGPVFAPESMPPLESWRAQDGSAPVAALQDWITGLDARADALDPDTVRIARQCRTPGWQCAAWLQELETGGEPAVALLAFHPGAGLGQILVLSRTDTGFERLGTARLPRRRSMDAWRSAVEAQAPQALAPLLPDLQIGGSRIHLVPRETGSEIDSGE